MILQSACVKLTKIFLRHRLFCLARHSAANRTVWHLKTDQCFEKVQLGSSSCVDNLVNFGSKLQHSLLLLICYGLMFYFFLFDVNGYLVAGCLAWDWLGGRKQRFGLRRLTASELFKTVTEQDWWKEVDN